MPNSLLTQQLAGRLFAEEIQQLLGIQCSAELKKAAYECARDCARLMGVLMDEDDPRAALEGQDHASQV